MHHTPFDLTAYAALHNLSLQAIQYIRQSMQGPSMLPSGYSSNIVRYPSSLTHQTITCHSRSWEYALVLMLHRCDPKVVFILEQPAELTLYYPSGNSQKPVQYRPDLLVLWEDRPPTIFEAKPVAKLAIRCLETPWRYQEDGHGNYRSDAAEQAAKPFGFTFRIVNERHFEPVYLQNIQFAAPYFSRELNPPPTDTEIAAILDQVRSAPGITIDKIVFENHSRRADLIYRLIALAKLFTHLSHELLRNQNRVALFTEPLQERAFLTFHGTTTFKPVSASSLPYEVVVGMQIQIKNTVYTVSKVGTDFIRVKSKNKKSLRIPFALLVDLLPKIDAVHNAKRTMSERIRRLSDDEVAGYLKRQQAILPYLPAGALFGKKPKQRSVRRWLAAYKKAEALSGLGLNGLIPCLDKKRGRKPRIPSMALRVIDGFIAKHYCNVHPRLTVIKTHYRICRLLTRLGQTYIPTYRLIARRCQAIDRHQKDRDRWGKRIGEATRMAFPGKSVLGSPHGQRSWEVAHCDHTERDLALNHPERAKRIEKSWHSKLVDATDHRVLAWVSSLSSPSTDTMIQLLRMCVSRHGTLPSMIVADWGADFRSTWLQKTLSHIGVTLLYRPKATAVNGAPIESSFAADDRRYIHPLTGGTEIMKRARQVTAAVNPKDHAIWTLRDLEEADQKYYDTVNNTPHAVLKCSPNARAQELADYLGNHPRKCMSEEMLRRLLLPLAKQTTRKVSAKGTVYYKRNHYSHPDLGKVRGEQVDVRYDPNDPRIIFVSHPLLDGLVECTAQNNRLKYAEDRFEAATIVAHMNTPTPEIEAERNKAWSTHDEYIEDKELLLRHPKKPKRPKPPIEEAPSADNVVDFEGSQGGMIRIARKEDQS